MNVNDDAGSLTPRVFLKSIASRLAPTESGPYQSGFFARR